MTQLFVPYFVRSENTTKTFGAHAALQCATQICGADSKELSFQRLPMHPLQIPMDKNGLASIPFKDIHHVTGGVRAPVKVENKYHVQQK